MRRLCTVCYAVIRRDDELADYPRVYQRAEDLVQDAAELLAYRNDKEWVAAKLGVKWNTITTARWRLRRRAAKRERENNEADHRSVDRHHDAEDGASA